MVQGLAFLSKKSWHTKNLANQEKVWMAEQQAAAEKSKTKELARQIQQEREQDELDRIAGKKSNRLDRGIDWMYQGGSGEAAEEDAKRAAEEFLLGKEYVSEGASKGGDFTSFDNSGINAVLASADAPPSHNEHVDGGESAAVSAAAYAEASADASEAAPAYDEGPSVADRNESFRLRLEDPMFLVSQKQSEKKTQIAKKKALYERVVGVDESTSDRRSIEDREERKRHRKRDKESKKDRKRDRKHHRSRRDKEEHGERKRRRRSRSRSRDRSFRRSDRDRQEHHGHDSYRSRRSRSRSEEHHRHGRYHDRSPYSSDDEYRRHHSSRRDDDRASGDRHRYQDGHHHHHERHRNHREETPSTRGGYGLQGSTKQSNRNEGLGPSRDLLAKKRQEKEAARRHGREKTSTRRRITDDERAEALRAMQISASQRDAALTKAVSERPRSVMDDHQDEVGSGGKASFLNDMTQQTHGIKGASSMASRVAQNRHTNQNVNDSFF